MTENIITVNEDQGQNLSLAGNAYRIIVSGEQTGGSYAVIDMLVPPGGGPAPHAHANIEETFYVVDGEIEFKSEAGSYTAKKGAFVYVPKGGMVHAFKNKSSTMAHLLCTVIPAGLEQFFKEVGTPVEAGTFLPPRQFNEAELENLKAVAEKHGQQLFPPNYLD